MASNQDIARMPIQEVVKLPGGNGLASPPFQIPLNIMLIFGWHNIEQGVEACVCDGVLIPATKLRSEFMRLMGRKSFVRRVLLKPAPFEIVASGLTQDELRLTLSTAIKYEVSDPVYVASLSDPLAELRHFFEGITAECIRTRSFVTFISDEGEVRAHLRDRFHESFAFTGKYYINEVLKAIPSGDETLIEIKRKTWAARQQQDLIKADGINKGIESSYNLSIAREQAKLDDEIAQRKHEREKEIRELEARSDIMKTAISALGQVAGSGIDPTKVAKEVIGTLVDRAQNTRLASTTNQALPGSPQSLPVSETNQVEIEKRALDSIKDRLGITTYEVLEENSKIRGAIIQMKGYEIVFICGEKYPQEKPEASARFPDGSISLVEDYWITGISNSLAQALLAIVPQIKVRGL